MISNSLLKIFRPQVDFEGKDALEKFTKIFCDLYRIELFKDGLDLIATKLHEKDLSFEIKIVTGWDTNQGCYLTEQRKTFNKFLGTFSNVVKKKIIIRNFNHNVMAHEMAHALEFESGLNLGEEFRKCIGLDMKGRQPKSLVLQGEIQRLMVDALKSYPQHQFISELFARYYELLSTSRNVNQTGGYTTSEVMEFFANTTNFIEKKFNPKIKAQINSKISAHSVEIVKKVTLEKSEKKFQEKVDSFHQRTSSSGSSAWSKNVRSNANWQAGWNKHQELEKQKNNNLNNDDQ